MAFTYGFYDSINHDRKYSAEQISSLFDGLITDGVFDSIGNKFSTVPGGGMKVMVKSGKAWFNHTWSINDSDYLLDISPADVTMSRIDTVVLIVDQNESVRANSLGIVQGTPATNPQKPPLLNTGKYHQYPLAYVTINGSATEIKTTNIEIVVGMSACPYVTGLVEHLSVEDLFNQWDGEFEDWFTTKEGEFDEWFENIQSMLSEEVIGNLQVQIDQRVKISDKASTAQAQAGTDNTKWMTPALVKAEIIANKVNVGDVLITSTSPGNNYLKCDGHAVSQSLIESNQFLKSLYGDREFYINNLKQWEQPEQGLFNSMWTLNNGYPIIKISSEILDDTVQPKNLVFLFLKYLSGSTRNYYIRIYDVFAQQTSSEQVYSTAAGNEIYVYFNKKKIVSGSFNGYIGHYGFLGMFSDAEKFIIYNQNSNPKLNFVSSIDNVYPSRKICIGYINRVNKPYVVTTIASSTLYINRGSSPTSWDNKSSSITANKDSSLYLSDGLPCDICGDFWYGFAAYGSSSSTTCRFCCCDLRMDNPSITILDNSDIPLPNSNTYELVYIDGEAIYYPMVYNYDAYKGLNTRKAYRLVNGNATPLTLVFHDFVWVGNNFEIPIPKVKIAGVWYGNSNLTVRYVFNYSLGKIDVYYTPYTERSFFTAISAKSSYLVEFEGTLDLGDYLYGIYETKSVSMGGTVFKKYPTPSIIDPASSLNGSPISAYLRIS